MRTVNIKIVDASNMVEPPPSCLAWRIEFIKDDGSVFEYGLYTEFDRMIVGVESWMDPRNDCNWQDIFEALAKAAVIAEVLEAERLDHELFEAGLAADAAGL